MLYFRRFLFIITLHLTILVQCSNALFFQELKQIWYSGGIGVTFISNPYSYNDHYDICLDTCRMSISCWMSGGKTVNGNCESIFHVCCQKYDKPIAEARKIHNWDDIVTNHVEEVVDSTFPEVYYGPIINDPDCGKKKVAGRRVVGGQNAGFGTYPWQVFKRIRIYIYIDTYI